MTRVSQKRSKVKKKKKTASKKKASAKKVKPSGTIKKKAVKRKKVAAKASGSIKKKAVKRKKVAAKKTSKAVKKISKKAAKRKTKKRVGNKRKKRGALRDFTDRVLGTRQSEVQVLQRLGEKLPGIFLPNMVETDESLMMQRLIRAEQLGTFDETARNLAMEFDWGLREVYELWHSPDVYF